MHEDESSDLARDFALVALNGAMPLVILTEPVATMLVCYPETDRSMRAVYSPHFSDRCKVMIACAMYAYNDHDGDPE
jgi:hypothetical protein